MAEDSDHNAENAFLGALIPMLSIFTAVLLGLVCYLYFQLRKSRRQHEDLIEEYPELRNLSERVQERRKSAILNLEAGHGGDIEQQWNQDIECSISELSGYPGRKSNGQIDIYSAEKEPWAVRKVRSLEKLTVLTNELATKPESQSPSSQKTRFSSRSSSGHSRKSMPQSWAVEVPSPLRTFSRGEDDMHHDGILTIEVPPLSVVKPRTPDSIDSRPCSQRSHRGIRYVRSRASESVRMGAPELNEAQESHQLRLSDDDVLEQVTQNLITQSHPNIKIPPHARTLSPKTSSGTLSGETDSRKPVHPLAKYNRPASRMEMYDMSEPILDRSFGLNLAFAGTEDDTPTKPRSSRAIKLRHYLKNARANRRSFNSTAGRAHRRSVDITASKPSRGRLRRSKSDGDVSFSLTEQERSLEKLATIDESHRDY